MAHHKSVEIFDGASSGLCTDTAQYVSLSWEAKLERLDLAGEWEAKLERIKAIHARTLKKNKLEVDIKRWAQDRVELRQLEHLAEQRGVYILQGLEQQDTIDMKQLQLAHQVVLGRIRVPALSKCSPPSTETDDNTAKVDVRTTTQNDAQ